MVDSSGAGFCRSAAPTTGRWTWHSHSSQADAGLAGQSGELFCADDPTAANRFYRRGFWRISSGGRNLVHADGTAALLVADTAWALPWPATEAVCRLYAADRQAKGFNAVLLMSVQPDMHARGPRDRTADEGFDIGFEDLSDGHLNQPNPAYFQTLDRLEAPATPVIVEGSRSMLAQAVANLLDNALKFSEAGDAITVQLRPDEGSVQLMVEDTGIGIPAREAPRLFQRFFRASNAAAYTGNGLGLAIVKAIVEQHDGSVRAEWKEQGLRFVLRLPTPRQG